MKSFSKKLLGHDNLSSMIVSGYEIFQEYFKQKTVTPSYILNVCSLKVFVTGPIYLTLTRRV